MTIDSILQQVARPQVANIAGALSSGVQAGQNINLNQGRQNLLQQQAAQTSSAAKLNEQKFTAFENVEAQKEVSNDVNTALGLGPGEARNKVLAQAQAKTPQGSAMHITLGAMIAAIGSEQDKMMQNVVQKSIQAGWIDNAKPTAGQIERKISATEAGLGLEKEKLEQQKIKHAENLAVKQQNADTSEKRLDTKLKRMIDEQSTHVFGSEAWQSYQKGIKSMTQGKTKFSPETVAKNVEAVLAGRLSPASVSKRGGLQALVVEGVMGKNPNFDFIKADADSRYLQSQGNLQSRALIKGVQPLYDKLREQGGKLNNTKIKMANAVKNWFKEQTGDADVVAFNNLRDDVVAETERILLGSGVLSDSKYLRAVETLKTSNSIEQINAAIDQFEMVVSARLHALDGKPFGTGENEINLNTEHEYAAEARLAQRALAARKKDKPKQNRRASDKAADPVLGKMSDEELEAILRGGN